MLISDIEDLVSYVAGEEEAERFKQNVTAEVSRNGGVIPREPGFVYAMNAVGTNCFKIGKSIDPDKRLLQISPKMPFDTELVAVWESDFMSRGERWMHGKLANFRMNGEWFELSAKDQCSFFLDSTEYPIGMRYAYAFDFWDATLKAKLRRSVEQAMLTEVLLGVFGNAAASMAFIEDAYNSVRRPQKFLNDWEKRLKQLEPYVELKKQHIVF